MNCFALEWESEILIVDCGTTFPKRDCGVDVIHPDFSWLLARASRVRGVFVTHGHEDHIGALPYLLRDLNVPVWGPSHALRLAEMRLAEHGFPRARLDFKQALAGTRYAVGPFVVEPIRVTHSIVEATALNIEVGGLRVVHSGDFKFDPDPVDGEATDETRLMELGDAGVDLLLSDSTNIDTPGFGGSERTVATGLERLISEAPGRVIVALFASNVQRLIAIGKIAQETGRRICLLGRSLQKNVVAATEIGRLRWPSDLCVAPEQMANIPHAQLLVLAGGTQGETGSTMARFAARDHQHLTLCESDLVLFSSRVIPGREDATFTMMAGLYRQGAQVLTRASHPEIHVSGHATRGEQQHLIELLRPRAFIPVHGTVHHLTRHAQLARDVGVKDVLWVENGTVVELSSGTLRRRETFPTHPVNIEWGGRPVPAETLKVRAELGRVGLCVVAAVVDSWGHIMEPLAVRFIGVSVPAEEAESAVRRAVGVGTQQDEASIQRIARRALVKRWGVRPLVEVTVTALKEGSR